MEMHVNDQITVGTAAVVISPQRYNSTRDNFTLTNSSTGGQVITVAVDTQAEAGHGFILYPGGSIDREAVGGHGVTQAQMTAIASAPGALLSIHEEVRV